MKYFFCLMVLIVCILPHVVLAQSAPVLIRDTEIEETLKGWSTPVFRAAGLQPDNVEILLVKSPEINAFVAGGANIFLYTGLFDRSEGPGEILGVIAHETGHISGGHLIATRQAMERASYEQILGALVGIGVAAAGGGGDAAMAGTAFGGSMGMGGFLGHSRAQEATADQAALRYFESARLSPHGLYSFMSRLADEEALPVSQQSEYIRTHPLTRTRADALQSGLERSKYADSALPAAWEEQHARIKAKLSAYLNPQGVVYTYPESDQSVAARYARTISAYRTSRIKQALEGVDGLIRAEPNNPYFHELRGQMLAEFGRMEEARSAYGTAARLKPDSALILTDYARTLIETAGSNRKQLEQAVEHLEAAKRRERKMSRIYRQLAIAQGRLGREAQAQLALAEEAALQGRYKDAERQANTALQRLPAGSNDARQAQDLLAYLSTRKP